MYGCMDGWMYAWTNTYVCIHVRMHVFIYRESESERDGSKRERAYMDHVHEMKILLKLHSKDNVLAINCGGSWAWRAVLRTQRLVIGRLSEALQLEGGDAHKWVQRE